MYTVRTRGAGCSINVSVQYYLGLFTDNEDHSAQAARIVLHSQTVAKISLTGTSDTRKNYAQCIIHYILEFHIKTVL